MPTLVGSDTAPDLDRPGLTNRSDEVHALHTAPTLLADAFCATCLAAIAGPFCPRPEEHTSELQSLMRISYAVFCLKKKKTKKNIINKERQIKIKQSYKQHTSESINSSNSHIVTTKHNR